MMTLSLRHYWFEYRGAGPALEGKKQCTVHRFIGCLILRRRSPLAVSR
jgi:hypothetical protein